MIQSGQEHKAAEHSPDKDKKMRSRMGKKTAFDFHILKDVDPQKMIDRHHKHMKHLESKGLYDKSKK